MKKTSKNSLNKRIIQKLPFLDDFLLFLTTSNYSRHTVSNYERDLEHFGNFLVENDLKFEDVSKKLIDHYKADLIAEDRQTLKTHQKSEALKAKSINRMLTSLRTYLTFLIDRDESTPIMPQHVKLMKLEKKVKPLPELDELIRFIESPVHLEQDRFIGVRNRLVLEILFAAGLRISEAVGLKVSQWEPSGKMYIMGKGRKERFVYVTPRVIRLAEEYFPLRVEFIRNSLPSSLSSNQEIVEKFECMFVTKKTFDGLHKEYSQEILDEAFVKHISDNYLQDKIKSYRLQIGISSPLSAHTLRHGFATYLAESGANPAALQVLLGHESLDTTTRYVHASDSFAENTHHSFHPLKK
jgi:site-specific recombinase XerD